MDWTTPVTSLETAKALYFAVGCSHGRMASEHPIRYVEYRRLNISGRQERGWSAEQICSLYTRLLRPENRASVPDLFSDMVPIAADLNTDDAYEMLLGGAQHLLDTKIGPEAGIAVARAITGELIHRAWRRGRRDHAGAFVRLADELTRGANSSEQEREEARRVILACKTLVKRLKIKGSQLNYPVAPEAFDRREKLKTREEARAFYCAMGCSRYRMDREEHERAVEYRLLNISERQERQWKTGYFYRLYEELRRERNGLRFFSLHSDLEEVVSELDTDEAYETLLEATRLATERVRDENRVVMSETLTGRVAFRYRNGPIFHAFDRGRHDHAVAFARLALELCRKNRNSAELMPFRGSVQRAQDSMIKCNILVEKLGLSLTWA